MFFFLIIRRPPVFTLTDPLFPFPTLFRSAWLRTAPPAMFARGAAFHFHSSGRRPCYGRGTGMNHANPDRKPAPVTLCRSAKCHSRQMLLGVNGGIHFSFYLCMILGCSRPASHLIVMPGRSTCPVSSNCFRKAPRGLATPT